MLQDQRILGAQLVSMKREQFLAVPYPVTDPSQSRHTLVGILVARNVRRRGPSVTD